MPSGQDIINGLMQTWPARLVKGAADGFMAPGRVLASPSPLTTEQMIQPASDMTGIMMGGGMPMAQRGALGIFGGKMASTADHMALNRAEHMAASGAEQSQILKDTGWFKGGDGGWRFEINDAPSVMKGGTSGSIPAVLDHPELYKAYPSLENIPLKWGAPPRSGSYGSPDAYNPHGVISLSQSDAIAGKHSVLLHELQHAIQELEGFATGSTSKVAGRDAYKRSAGEVEARNVEDRLKMSQDMRRESPPWKTQDTPYNQQLIDFLVKGGV